ncbi:Nuclease domain-containing protein 1 [Panicum miliaceum]|uniref:Nuclease domain-containing protein 1 n=1 Tax=Panicum miliaceum TaxID=4540 RepID=A0A3L6PUU6_PANMI|nr:Nuclease domain-containing protein 1 [Panicum miliaceum]
MGSAKAEMIPLEKSITLSSINAPRLVKEQRHNKSHTSPYIIELLRLEEIARGQGLHCWTKEPGAAEALVRILPSSTIGEASPSGKKGFVAEMRGKALEAIVEQVYIAGVQGFAKYMEWRANMLGAQTKRNLKNAELQAKKEQLRIWIGFQPPVTNITPIHNQKFTGKVIEVVNGYCTIVADDIYLLEVLWQSDV